MVDIIVAGAAGRMGARIVACMAEAPDLRLVAALEAPGHPALGVDAGEVAGLARPALPVTAHAAAALSAGHVPRRLSAPDPTRDRIPVGRSAGAAGGPRTNSSSA